MGKRRFHKGTTALIRYAEEFGFQLMESTGAAGGGHIKMQHTGNGAIMVFPSTPRVDNSENTKADIRRFAKNGRQTGSCGK